MYYVILYCQETKITQMVCLVILRSSQLMKNLLSVFSGVIRQETLGTSVSELTPGGAFQYALVGMGLATLVECLFFYS